MMAQLTIFKTVPERGAQSFQLQPVSADYEPALDTEQLEGYCNNRSESFECLKCPTVDLRGRNPRINEHEIVDLTTVNFVARAVHKATFWLIKHCP